MSLFGELMQGSSKLWENEADALHPFHHLAKLSQAERAAEVGRHVLKVVPKVVAAMVLMIGEAKYPKSELEKREDPGGKFSNTLVLCNSKIFQLGECHSAASAWFRVEVCTALFS